jgi:CRP-like cAMP-binding protein
LTSSRRDSGTQQADHWKDRLPACLGCTGKSADLIYDHQLLLSADSGIDIFTQSSRPNAIYLLLKGKISIVGNIQGLEVPMGNVTSGKLCDIAACVSGSPHNYTARSMIPCDFSVLPIEIWRRLAEADPSVMIKVADHISADLRNIWSLIAS